MRAHELLGSEVLAADGKKLGHVFDIEAEGVELRGLLVGPAAFFQRLGYHRSDMRGPAGIRFLAGRFRGYEVMWEDIAKIDPHRVTLSVTAFRLRRLDKG